jgi:TatD DNase family protein
MKEKIVDSHCHFNLIGTKEENFNTRKKEIILLKIIEAIKNNVHIIQNVCVNLEEFNDIYRFLFDEKNGILNELKNSSIIKNLIEKENINIDDINKFSIYTSFGVHPLYKESEFDVQKAESFFNSYKFVNAIGECGLDYFKELDSEEKRQQQKKFLLQIDFALKKNLPLIIHTRSAEDQTHHYLYHSFMRNKIKGVMHCFTGSMKFAMKMLDLDFYISFPGIITFKKNIDYLHEIIKAVPLNRILIETDAPYLAPEPFRGKENHPGLLYLTCKKIAEIKKLEFDEVAKETTKNYYKLFLNHIL